MPRSAPQVAHSEEYDSDANSVRPGTRNYARRRSTVSRPPKAIDKYIAPPRDAASDSGYSSHASGALPSNMSPTAQSAPAVQAASKPVKAHSSTKTKPVLHRSESQRSKSKTVRSSSASRQGGQCADLRCQHAICHATRSLEGQQPPAQPSVPQYASQYTLPAQQYQQPIPQYQYQYAQLPQPAGQQNVPTLAAQPRLRQGNTARPTRPASVHGYSFPGLYASSNPGPPPSASAYQNQNMQYAAWLQAYHHQQQQQQQVAYPQARAYAPSVTNSNSPIYPQPSPLTTSPTSPTTSSMYQPSYSARINQPSYEAAAQSRPNSSLSRTYSARQAPGRRSTVYGPYPCEDVESSETSSDTDSSTSEFSQDEYERDHRSRARDSRLMSSSSDQRPSLKRRSATSPMVPTRSTRDVIHRTLKTLRKDPGLDSISSSDNMDSDRTVHAVVGGRSRTTTAYTGSSRNSRRPSIATTESSGRTKATTVSNNSGFANVTVPRNGRDISYLSQRERDAVAQKDKEMLEWFAQRFQGQTLEDAVNAYQRGVRGSEPLELTSDDIREHERRGSRSHYSSHSRRSSRSSSRRPEVTRIESGGTVIHVYPGSTFEMRPGNDGTSTLVIGTASDKDKIYRSGSRSSGYRRASRSYGGSDGGSRHEVTIQEDDAYEQPPS